MSGRIKEYWNWIKINCSLQGHGLMEMFQHVTACPGVFVYSSLHVSDIYGQPVKVGTFFVTCLFNDIQEYTTMCTH
jgi:hypothetical protein